MTASGFEFLPARYYDPNTAQFLTRDPLEALTRSAYGYAGGNPVNMTDPSGLCPMCLVVLGGALLGGGIDLGFQMLDNVSHGCGALSDINWTSVAAWSLLGGVTAGAGEWLVATTRFEQSVQWAWRVDKIEHLFQAKHGLAPLVESFGSEYALFREVLAQTARQAPRSGVFTRLVVSVGGASIEVSGFVEKGIVKIGDMWVI